MTLSEVSKTLFCIFFHIFYWKHTEIANHPSPFTFSTKIPTNKQLTAVKGWLNPSPPFTTLHHPSLSSLLRSVHLMEKSPVIYYDQLQTSMGAEYHDKVSGSAFIPCIIQKKQ